jgi:hypothetical protein
MSKTKNNLTSQDVDVLSSFDASESWAVTDPGDQSFWDEFFKIEEVLEATDEIDPPTFSITVQNHRTGEVKTYNRIHLKSAKQKIVC